MSTVIKSQEAFLANQDYVIVKQFSNQIEITQGQILSQLEALTNEMRLMNQHLKKLSGLDITVSDVEEEL